MKKLRVKQLNQHNLKVARENIGWTTRQVTDRICGKKTKLDKVKLWEAGEDYPTFVQLKKLGKEYNLNYFSLTDNSIISRNRAVPSYRKVSGRAQNLNLSRFINFLLQRQEYLEDVMADSGALPNKIAGALKHKDLRPQSAAKIIARKLEYKPRECGKKPGEHLQYLLFRLEANGVFVMKTLSYWPISRDYMQGLYLHSKYAPIIALNRRDVKTAQLFTLAHEIAHLFRQREGIPESNVRTKASDPEERFCNQIAANLLLPEELFATKEYTYGDINVLANTYQISSLFVFYRLQELGLIERSKLRKIHAWIERDFYAEQLVKNKAARVHRAKTSDTAKHTKPDESLLKILGRRSSQSYARTMKDSNGALYNNFVSSLYSEGELSPVETENLLLFSIEEL